MSHDELCRDWHEAVTYVSTSDPTLILSLNFTVIEIKWSPYVSCASHECCFLCEILPLTSIRCRLTTSSTMTLSAVCVLTNCDAFIPGSIPPKQALALTEQSVMAMFIVHALNRQHMAWAAVSGAKFVPLCSFRGYLWLAPCWLDALLADNGSLCVTDC